MAVEGFERLGKMGSALSRGLIHDTKRDDDDDEAEPPKEIKHPHPPDLPHKSGPYQQ